MSSLSSALDEDVAAKLLEEWKTRCREEWENKPLAGFDLPLLLINLEPDAKRLLKAFHRQEIIGQREYSEDTVRQIYANIIDRFDQAHAHSLLAFLIRTTASSFQDRFSDFEGSQYSRIVSPDIILGDRVAFRNLREALSSEYIASGALSRGYRLLHQTGKKLDDPMPLLKELDDEVRHFLLAPVKNAERWNNLSVRLTALCNILEDDHVDTIAPDFVDYLNGIEDKLVPCLQAIRQLKPPLAAKV